MRKPFTLQTLPQKNQLGGWNKKAKTEKFTSITLCVVMVVRGESRSLLWMGMTQECTLYISTTGVIGSPRCCNDQDRLIVHNRKTCKQQYQEKSYMYRGNKGVLSWN